MDSYFVCVSVSIIIASIASVQYLTIDVLAAFHS